MTPVALDHDQVIESNAAKIHRLRIAAESKYPETLIQELINVNLNLIMLRHRLTRSSSNATKPEPASPPAGWRWLSPNSHSLPGASWAASYGCGSLTPISKIINVSTMTLRSWFARWTVLSRAASLGAKRGTSISGLSQPCALHVFAPKQAMSWAQAYAANFPRNVGTAETCP